MLCDQSWEVGSQGDPGYGRAERRDSLPGRVQTLCTSAMEPDRAFHGTSEHTCTKGSVLATVSETTDTAILSLVEFEFLHNPSLGVQRYSINCWTPVFLLPSCCSLYLDVRLPPVIDKWWPQRQTQPQGTRGAQAAHAGPVESTGTISSELKALV